MYVYMYIYMYVCIYIYVGVYIYIYWEARQRYLCCYGTVNDMTPLHLIQIFLLYYVLPNLLIIISKHQVRWQKVFCWTLVLLWQSHHLPTHPLSSFLSRDFHQSTTRSWKFNNASHSCLCHVPKLFAIQALSFYLLSLFLLMYWHRYFTMTFCMISYLLLCTYIKMFNQSINITLLTKIKHVKQMVLKQYGTTR